MKQETRSPQASPRRLSDPSTLGQDRNQAGGGWLGFDTPYRMTDRATQPGPAARSSAAGDVGNHQNDYGSLSDALGNATRRCLV